MVQIPPLTIKAFKDLSLQQKVQVMEGYLKKKDPKILLEIARLWGLETTPADLVNRYYRAQALKALGWESGVKLEVVKIIALSAGISDIEGFDLRGDGKIYLPKDFFDKFPEFKEFAEKFWNDLDLSIKELKPAFSLNKTGIDGLANRGYFGEDYGQYDFWPPRMDKGADRDTPAPDFDRSEIATLVIDSILRKHPLKNSGRLKRNEAEVITFGSCFAANLNRALAAKGIKTKSLRIEEPINTTHANRLLLESILKEDAVEELKDLVGDVDLSILKEVVLRASAIVLTVGVSPVTEWVDTGKLCLTDKYRPLFDAGQVRQRFTSVEENKKNIVEIVRLLRQHNEKAQVFLTLSPVPLIGVADGSSVFERDVVSKSTLRLAIDEAAKEIDFSYWPSFEVAKWVAPHVPLGVGYQAYGEDDKNSRHVSRWIVDVIVDRFIEQVFEE